VELRFQSFVKNYSVLEPIYVYAGGQALSGVSDDVNFFSLYLSGALTLCVAVCLVLLLIGCASLCPTRTAAKVYNLKLCLAQIDIIN